MKLRITHTTGEYEEIDTEAKLASSAIIPDMVAQVRTRVRFDQLTGFEDREDGLWLELWGAVAKEPGEIVSVWTPLCMIRQIADTEFDYIAKVTSSREDGAGGDGQLEMCRMMRPDGTSKLVSFSRAMAWLDLYGEAGSRDSAMDIVYDAFRAWCRGCGVRPEMANVPRAAAAIGIPKDITSTLVEMAMKAEMEADSDEREWSDSMQQELRF